MSPLHPPILLNADADPVGFVFQIGGAVLGLIAVVVVGWFAIVRIRAWMHTSEDASAPFTLDDLRRLHREGTLSDEEFQRAREAMIGAVRSQKARESSSPDRTRLDPERIDPLLARQIEAHRSADRRTDSGTRTPPMGQPAESTHGETVVRRPSILRNPPEGGAQKRAE